MNRVEKIVSEMAGPITAGQDCSLWAVEYAKEGGRWVLRVLIDHEGGVNTVHCEAVSRALDPLLDEQDPIPGSYMLEVSSAGLERPLKRPEDFRRMMGRAVLVRLYAPREGVREFIGTLSACDGETLTLEGQSPAAVPARSNVSDETSRTPERLKFPVKDLALVRLYVEW